jgi:hypothetical protein
MIDEQNEEDNSLERDRDRSNRRDQASSNNQTSEWESNIETDDSFFDLLHRLANLEFPDADPNRLEQCPLCMKQKTKYTSIK